MGLRDNISTNQEKKTYAFMDGDIRSLTDEMLKPKIETGINDRPADESEDLEEPATEKEAFVKTVSSISGGTAKFLVASIDAPLTSLLAWVAKEDNTNNLATSPDQRESLEEALQNYMKEKGGDVPPGVMLLIIFIATYAGKIPTVISLRKAHKRADMLQNKVTESEKQIAELQAQIEKYKETDATKK